MQQIANISSDLLEGALDKLMEPAIRAIEGCSDLYAVTVAEALAARAFDVRHRPSRSDAFFNNAAKFLLTRDIILGLSLKLNHDRNIAMCDQFLLSTAGVDSATEAATYRLNSAALAAMSDAVMATKPGKLYLARATVEFALRNVLQLREDIANQYERFAIQQASQSVRSRVHVNFEVASSQATKGIYTAIDRYSAERGALAAYVKLWVRQALLDKTNLQEGAAIDLGSSGGVNDNRAEFLKRYSTTSVSLDTTTVSETLAQDNDGFSDRHGEHTRALAAIPSLRPTLRAAGESLRYELNNRERSMLLRLN